MCFVSLNFWGVLCVLFLLPPLRPLSKTDSVEDRGGGGLKRHVPPYFWPNSTIVDIEFPGSSLGIVKRDRAFVIKIEVDTMAHTVMLRLQ